MVPLLVFWLLVFGALTTGWQAGDRHDRRAILWIASAAILSTTAYLAFEGPVSSLVVAIIDITLLLAIVRYALRGTRYWPLWFAGFHTTGLTMNLAGFLLPAEYNFGFNLTVGLWGIAALVAMVAGLLADQKAEGRLAQT